MHGLQRSIDHASGELEREFKLTCVKNEITAGTKRCCTHEEPQSIPIGRGTCNDSEDRADEQRGVEGIFATWYVLEMFETTLGRSVPMISAPNPLIERVSKHTQRSTLCHDIPEQGTDKHARVRSNSQASSE